MPNWVQLIVSSRSCDLSHFVWVLKEVVSPRLGGMAVLDTLPYGFKYELWAVFSRKTANVEKFMPVTVHMTGAV